MSISNAKFNVDECGSTNEWVKQYSENHKVASGSIFQTDYQTQGHGYYGNKWESEKGKNLIFSIFFLPKQLPANKVFVISEMASLSVKYTLDKYIHDVSVKWPNDIYYRDKKISGILIENVIMEQEITQSIIGIGININQMQFLGNAPNPVSLAQITGEKYNLTSILDEFNEIFTNQSKLLGERRLDDIHKNYLDAVYRKKGRHKYSDVNGVFEATIHDIEPSGHLILEHTNGVLSRYAFKEITFL